MEIAVDKRKRRIYEHCVIGIGDIGAVIVKKLRDAGYPLKMANSKGQTHSESSRRKLEQYLFQSKRSFKMSISFFLSFLKSVSSAA